MSATPIDPTRSAGGVAPAPSPAGVAPSDADLERVAVDLRTRGLSAPEATTALARRFPTASEADVTFSVNSAYTYRDGDGRTQHDNRAARELAPMLAPRHRYVITPGAPEGRWYFYDGARWRDDAARVELSRSIEAQSRRLAQDERSRDNRALGARLAKASGEATAIRALAKHLALTADALDSNPELVGLADCTAHVRGRARGRVRENSASDYLTKGLDVAYRPETIGSNIEWHTFGLSILDAETWRWLNLTLARWALHGDAPPFMLVLHGPTNAGKTTFAETLLAVLSDLGATGSLAAFIEQATPGPNSSRAALFGPRLVSLSEAGKFDAIASPPFKTYTSGGMTNFEEKFSRQASRAKPTALLVLDTNHLPRVDGADDAVMRRLRLVPFSRRFYSTDTEAERAAYDAAVANGDRPGIIDPTLADRLKSRESLEAILAWWLALLRESPDAEPAPPLVVQRATEAWRAQANPLAAFIDGRYEFEPGGEVVLAEFADDLREWLAASLPDRVRDYRDNRQVSAALRDLPPRTLRVERMGAGNVRTVIGLRRVEEAS